MSHPVTGPSQAPSSVLHFYMAGEDGFHRDDLKGTMDNHEDAADDDVGMRFNFTSRPLRAESQGAVMERYSGALKMLRNQLWSNNFVGNVTFEEADSDEVDLVGHMVSREKDLSQLIPIERDICSRSCLFLKRLLMNADTVPLAVIDEVLSDETVVKKLKGLNNVFSFGKRGHHPKDKIDETMATTVQTMTAVFNANAVPAVMWPFTDALADHNERVRIDESVVFEAIQIYRMRKHNRETYVEWGRNTSMTSHEEGPLALDVTNTSTLREISDTILDELTSTMWCLSFLSLQIHSVGADYIKPYASSILEDHKSITTALWDYYLAFSSHVNTLYGHIKRSDKSLNDNLYGRMIVELHRILTLQCSIVRTLLAIHVGTRSMDLSEYQRYCAHFQQRHFTGILPIARSIIGNERCESSTLLIHAVHELQTVGTLLLSSFFLYDRFGAVKNADICDAFLDETVDLMRSLLSAIDSGKNDNHCSPILLFAYACFLQKVSTDSPDRKVDSGYITDVSRYLDQYSESFEWVTFSRDMFVTTGNGDHVVNFPSRMLLMESLSQVINMFSVEEVRRLDSVVNAISVVVDKCDLQLDRGYYLTKKSVLERISSYLMSHFPFGLSIFFQLLGALLPVCVEPHADGDMGVEGDGACMELITKFLLSSLKSITVSPFNAPLDHKDGAADFSLTGDMHIGIQMLYMLGFNMQTLQANWSKWDMGSCLHVLKAGTTGQYVNFDSLKNLSFHARSQADNDKRDLWLVDAGLNILTPRSSPDEVWTHESSLQKTGDTSARLCGCQFELESAMSFVIDDTQGKTTEHSDHLHFTLLHALWTVWHGSITYMANDTGHIPIDALQTFVTCNSMMTSLVTMYPRVTSLIETHIMSSLYRSGSMHKSPFGPSSIVYNYTLLFLVCLKRPQLRIMLPEVIEALRSFLVSAFVVPAGDNATEVEFSRFWIFFQSLEFCSQLLADENGFHMFTLLHRVMQEEERYLHTYPVTGAVLKFFKELLQQCPPELWMLSCWHHGMLNLSHTSLEMESSNLTHGLGLSYLKMLKRYIDGNSVRAKELYSPFQSLLLCEMFTYVLKNVGLGIGECEYADSNERFDMLLDIVEIVHLVCRIFRVYNYDTGRSPTSKPEQPEPEDSWVQGLNELINRILLIFSESNYIMEVVNILAHEIDILHYHNETRGGSLAIVNPLLFSEMSMSFFTARTLLYRRMGILMHVSHEPTKTHAIQCQTSCKYSWLSKPHLRAPCGQSKRIITTALKLLKELYVTALPENRNPLFTTLADNLGSNFFVRSRPAAEHRRKFLMPSEHIHDLNDPIVYFALKQIHMLCAKLPQISLVQSLFTHTYDAANIAMATDVVSLYVLLREQSKVKRGSYIEIEMSNDRLLLEQLGHLRGHYDVIALTNKDEACFYEHLICAFLDPKTCSYEARISILQYFLVALSTCSGMEFLIRNNGLDFDALLDFVDSILRYHVMHGHSHNLGDLTLAQYALLIFSRLLELSKGTHKSYCWKSVHQSLRVLVTLWRRFDSNFFVDGDVSFGQNFVVPRSTMAKELWFDRSKVDYYIDISDSMVERRLGLLRIMGSLHAILNALCLKLRFANDQGFSVSDGFLKMVTFVSMNWDFMDALFPIVVYDSGFVDTYVKNDVTETNMGQYYRLGLWLGEDCSTPLSKCLHYLYDMKIQHHYLLMQNPSRGIEPMDVQALLGTIVRNRMTQGHNTPMGLYSADKLGVETFTSLLADIMGPPETNALNTNIPMEQQVDKDNTSASATVSHDYAFYTFGTAYEFGYNYLTDVEKFHHLCVVLLTSRDEKVNFLLSREMPNVRRCIELVPYIESLNDLKMRILTQLCTLVDLYKKSGRNLSSRIQQVLTTETRVGDNGSMRMVKCSMQPFEMFAFNGTMLLQLILTRPDCIAEHPVYSGLLLQFLNLVYSEGVSLQNIENSFISYYECCGSTDVDDGGIVDYIVSRDQIATSDKSVVGQEFRLFAVNVLGGLVAQVARYITEFGDRYHDVLNVNFRPSSTDRTSLNVRIAALNMCLQYHESESTTTGVSVFSSFSKLDGRSTEQRNCACRIASGKSIDIDNISVWLNFKITAFFSQLYKLFSHAAKSGHKMEVQWEGESVLDVYQRVTKYALKGISQCCKIMIGLLHRESEYFLQCFMDAGSDILREGELESVYVFILGPYTVSMALESIVSTEFNREFLRGNGYMYMMDLAGSLTLLPYMTSICISTTARGHMGDILNSSSIMRHDRKYMAECMSNSEGGGLFQYENHNWLRATLYKCLERLNNMMMYGASCKTFLSSVVDSQLFQRIYLYSFLSHFVQPLYYVNPKTMLSKYSQYVCDNKKGDCIEVIENNITMWYPPYQGSCKRVLVRCPYHMLHCGLLKFVVEACSSHVVEGTMRDHHADGEVNLMSLVLEVLRLLRMRIQYVFTVTDLTLAHLEECHTFFSLLRNIHNWRRLSGADVLLMKEIIQWSIVHFSTVIQALQNGLDKLGDHVPPQTVLESPDILGKLVKVAAVPANVNGTTATADTTTTTTARGKPPRSYQQRALYLILKSSESFLSFLLNLNFTLECDLDVPPTMDSFVKTGDATGLRRMCPVDRESFISLVSGSTAEGFTLRAGDYQPAAHAHEMTFEVMTKAFNSCVEICVLALRLWKELRSSNKSAFIYGFRSDGNVYIPLSLSISGAGEQYTEEVFGGIRCAIYKEVKVVAASHVDVAPVSIVFGDLNALFECVIEKSMLFSAKVVNTAFVQNQLCQHDDTRTGDSISNWRTVATETTSGINAEFHSTLTLLNNALSDIAVHSAHFSKSTVDFCAMIETLVTRRTDQAKLLSAVFHDSFVYLERE